MTHARRASGLAAFIAAVLCSAGLTSPAAPRSPPSSHAWGGAGRRTAPLVTEKATSTGRVRLGDPLLVDSRSLSASPTDRGEDREETIIEGFRFTAVEAPAEPLRATARLVIRPPMPGPERVLTWEGGIARGAEIQIPAHCAVTPEMEGPFTALLNLRDAEGGSLFEGTYGFGYPRYRTSSNLELADRRFVVRDDFEGDRIDETRWRIWLTDPGSARVEQKGGRLWVHTEGTVGYNGVVSRAELDTRDLEVVCRAGIQSPGAADHHAIIHLCGCSQWSPDHWLEIKLLSRGENVTRAAAVPSIPVDLAHGDRAALDLIHDAGEGHLFKISSDGFTNMTRAFVRLDGAWQPLGGPFEVPARTTRLELKAEGWRKSDRPSSAWFDDCRLYPRPESSYVVVSFHRADGRRPAVGIAGTWPPVAFDAGNRPFTGRDVTVRLLAADGESLVAEARAGDAMEFGLLKLREAPWDAYPVEAILQIFVKGTQLGPDHVIRGEGVDGLYPDDVYSLTLE